MGYTEHTVGLLEKVIGEYHPKNVLDLGSQQLYNQPLLPAPYVDSWYREQGISYFCVDLNGENNAFVWDLSTLPEKIGCFEYDMVVDAGTGEHIGKDGHFDWDAVYNCWKNKHICLKTGGIMVNENPLSKNWPGHGFNYLELNFYKEFCKVADYALVGDGIHPAMGNTTDGYNLWSILRKTGNRFPSLEQFKTLPIAQS